MVNIRPIKLEDLVGWNNLIEKSNTASFFQQKEWLTVWLKHFSTQGGKELILGIYDNDDLIGIAPFYIKDTSIQFLGVSPVLGEELVSDFGDIVTVAGREKEVWQVVFNKLNNETMKQLNNGKTEFNFIREDSPSLKILQELGGKVEEVDVAPYIELPKTWDEYLASLDRHRRHELRRKMRKIDEKKNQLIKYQGEEELIEKFFQLMVISHEGKRKFLSEEMKVFFKDIIYVFWNKGMIDLNFLNLEGKIVSVAILFYSKDSSLLYNSGFDPEFSYLSAGLIHKAYLIKEAVEKGKKIFDFLRGDERYKFDLGGRKRKLYKITIM